jgi:hypothetical protein
MRFACLKAGYRFESPKKAMPGASTTATAKRKPSTVRKEAESAADTVAKEDERTVVVEEHGD